MSQGTRNSSGTTPGGAIDLEGAAMRERSRAGVVAVLVVSLVLSVVARQWAQGARSRAPGTGTAVTEGGSGLSVGRIDSYALALLLGGLRGPLVMVLWTTSEQQKSERDLEDFDTKVEWIRLLQPEFDSVHIFQIWNKAYNISVQMASLANKYATILDAVDYGNSVSDERPNNINILTALAQVWFEKLGQSNEKVYYRNRVRQESLAQPGGPTTRRTDSGLRRTRLDPMLDEKGMLLPALLKPTVQSEANIATSPGKSTTRPAAESVNGAELQFLEQWQPFPEGLSPLAIGYNYYKRAQVLQSSGRQKHLQLSELVIDSRPALSLKIWGEEEWERARRFEILAFGLKPGVERVDLEMPTADVRPDSKIVDPARLDSAIYAYDRAVTLGSAAMVEYERHLAGFTSSLNTYQAHMDFIRAWMLSCEADRDYLKALTATGADRTKLAASAREKYIVARDLYAYSALRYYSDDRVLPVVLSGLQSKYELKIDPSKPGEMTRAALGAHQLQLQRTDYDQYGEDRLEFITYVNRISKRLEALGAR